MRRTTTSRIASTERNNIPVSDDPGYDDILTENIKKRSLRIIIVEDSYADFDDIARSLRKMENFEVTLKRAKTIEDARFAISEERFDIALIDFFLGNESGARLLREIKDLHRLIVPILVTGLNSGKVEEIALREGAVGCIVKDTITPALMETTIRYCIHNHTRERILNDMLIKASGR